MRFDTPEARREWNARLRVARRDPDHAAEAAAELRSWLETLDLFTQRTLATRPRTTGLAYPTYQRFVLDNGRAMPGAARPKGIRKGRDRQCYANALHLALRGRYGGPPMRYVEGFALAYGGIVVEHAWCLDAAGTVVDPTWRDPDLATYYGVEMDLDVVGRIVSHNRVYGVLCNDWRNDSAILRTGRVELAVPA